MKKLILMMTVLLAMSAAVQAADHVMAATKGSKVESRKSNDQDSAEEAPKALNLSLKEAQDYAIKQNRSLKNASLAV